MLYLAEEDAYYGYIDGQWDLSRIACDRLISTLPGGESIYIPGQPTAAEAVR